MREGISLTEWGQKLKSQLAGRRFPLGATLELTQCCNLNCVHCYISGTGSRGCGNHQEMSLDEITKILDQMAEVGVVNLLLTGGEVFLRPDFLDIYQHAKQLGMLVTIFTNGTLVDERTVDFLAQWPPFFIEISSYGYTRNTYERVTRVPGSFDCYRRGLQLLLDRGISLGVKTVVMTVNQHEFHQLRAFAEDLNLPFRYDGLIWPRLDGSQEPVNYRLSPEAVVALDRDEGFISDKDLKIQPANSRQLSREFVYACGAGYHGFHVNAFGKMSMCIMARQPAYDLREGNLEQGWEFLGRLREKKRKLIFSCLACPARLVCTQCPGWSQIVHGDDETPVDYVCRIGQLRYASLSKLQKNNKRLGG